MSKMDRLREMREARYAEDAKRAPAQRASPVKKATAPARARAEAAAPPPDSATGAPDAAEELCGHRNMGGRTCTRERGHTAKSHRYS